MALEQRHVQITSPCPAKLDPNRGKDGAKSWYCGHCEKSVHVLSNMTEPEARSLLEDKEGQDLCVSYAVRDDGTIRFKEPARDPMVVPLSALRRRPSRRPAAASVVAAAGLTAALAACTPHERPDTPQPHIAVQDDPEVGGIGPVVIPVAEPTDESDHEPMVDGGLKGGPVPMSEPKAQDLPKPGGIRVAPLPEPETKEPCDPDEDSPPKFNYLGGI